MKLGLPIVWSDRHRLHEPGGEVWIGVRTPGTEVPRRAEAIRDALRACDAPFVAAEGHPADDVLAVPAAALVDYLRTAWDDRAAAGLPTDPGQDRGVDAATSDLESPLDVADDAYREAGRILGRLGLPRVLVQEGRYDLNTIGALVAETLAGGQEGATRA